MNQTTIPMTVRIGDRAYDMSELSEVAALQAKIVPDNWPGTPAEGVRNWMQTEAILTHLFRRHLAHNWKKLSKNAQSLREDNEPATFKANFAFEVDMSAIQVIMVTAHSMSYTDRSTTKGKPVTHDMNQGDFYAQMEEVVDTGSLLAQAKSAHETADAPLVPEGQGEELPPGTDDPNAQDGGEEKPKKPRKPRKKSGKDAAAGES